MSTVTLNEAQSIVDAALKESRAIDAIMAIAVVDTGGHLKAFACMDGAMLGVIDIAIRKARTARPFNTNSGEIGKLSQPGQPAYGVEHSNGGSITFPGGVPLKRGEEIVGAVGVSGSSVDNDHLVADADLAAMA